MDSFIVKAVITVDKKTGRKKIVGLHFPTETVRQLTDKDFIKRKK